MKANSKRKVFGDLCIIEGKIFCRICDSSTKCFFYKVGTELMTIGSLLGIFRSLICNAGTELCTWWAG